jgi:glycosyltransferase involved in cell wall biosynthesis
LRVLHVIVGLDVGGAENMLKRLIESDPDSILKVTVVSLTTLGSIGPMLRGQGIKVHALGMSSALSFPITLFRLIFLIRQYRPEIVQTWMYHADLLGGLAARLAGSSPVVWNVRSTNIPQGALSVTFWLIRLCAVFSYFTPDRIICCANSAKTAHIKLRYAEKKMTVIPNGYNFESLNLCLSSRSKARLSLGFQVDDIVIGAVGRFDPLKDFHNFIAAASKLSLRRNDVKYVMVGRNIEWSNATLRCWIEDAGLTDKFLLLGERSDIPSILSAMDIFCLSSFNEAFPNVVVEAMAMGVPCVVTRAGDAAEIIGNDKFVVPVKDSIALSDALLRLCDLSPADRTMLGEKGARRVRREYEIDEVRKRYEKVYVEVASK